MKQRILALLLAAGLCLGLIAAAPGTAQIGRAHV